MFTLINSSVKALFNQSKLNINKDLISVIKTESGKQLNGSWLIMSQIKIALHSYYFRCLKIKLKPITLSAKGIYKES